MSEVKFKPIDEITPGDIPGEVRSLEAGWPIEDAWLYGDRIRLLRDLVADMALGKGARFDEAGIWLAKLCKLEDHVASRGGQFDTISMLQTHAGFRCISETAGERAADKTLINNIADFVVSMAKSGSLAFASAGLSDQLVVEECRSLVYETPTEDGVIRLDYEDVEEMRSDIITYYLPVYMISDHLVLGHRANDAVWTKLDRVRRDTITALVVDWIGDRVETLMDRMVELSKASSDCDATEAIRHAAYAIAASRHLFRLDAEFVAQTLLRLDVDIGEEPDRDDDDERLSSEYDDDELYGYDDDDGDGDDA